MSANNLTTLGQHIVMPPVHRDERTGAVWVHESYAQRMQPFEAQASLSPSL